MMAAALALGSFGMFSGIKKIGSFHYSLITKAEPLFVALLAALFFREILKPTQYLGIVLVVACLVGGHRIRTRLEKTNAPPVAP